MKITNTSIINTMGHATHTRKIPLIMKQMYTEYHINVNFVVVTDEIHNSLHTCFATLLLIIITMRRIQFHFVVIIVKHL